MATLLELMPGSNERITRGDVRSLSQAAVILQTDILTQNTHLRYVRGIGVGRIPRSEYVNNRPVYTETVQQGNIRTLGEANDLIRRGRGAEQVARELVAGSGLTHTARSWHDDGGIHVIASADHSPWSDLHFDQPSGRRLLRFGVGDDGMLCDMEEVDLIRSRKDAARLKPIFSGLGRVQIGFAVTHGAFLISIPGRGVFDEAGTPIVLDKIQ